MKRDYKLIREAIRENIDSIENEKSFEDRPDGGFL